MEIGILDLQSRVSSSLVRNEAGEPFTLAEVALGASGAALELSRALLALHDARSRAQPLVDVEREALARALPCALGAVLAAAQWLSLSGADLGRQAAQAAVAPANGRAPGALWLHVAAPQQQPAMVALRAAGGEPAMPGANLVCALESTSTEPPLVDGYPWTKRDEIAEKLLLAGGDPERSLAVAAKFLRERAKVNAAPAGVPLDPPQFFHEVELRHKVDGCSILVRSGPSTLAEERHRERANLAAVEVCKVLDGFTPRLRGYKTELTAGCSGKQPEPEPQH